MHKRSNFIKISLGILGGGISGWLYARLIMTSIVASIGMLVNKLSTSSDAIMPSPLDVYRRSKNSLVELTEYCLGRYGEIIWLSCLDNL